MPLEPTPQELSNDSMRRSEIESKYAQFVQVNERLLRFIKGEEGPDEDFEEKRKRYFGQDLQETPSYLFEN